MDMTMIPYVIEQTGRGERSYDIFSPEKLQEVNPDYIIISIKNISHDENEFLTAHIILVHEKQKT